MFVFRAMQARWPPFTGVLFGIFLNGYLMLFLRVQSEEKETTVEGLILICYRDSL